MAHVLVDVKDGVELPPSRLPNVWVLVNRYGEATLSVDKPHNSMRIELKPRRRSFLLIVPTRHVVTAHASNRIFRV